MEWVRHAPRLYPIGCMSKSKNTQSSIAQRLAMVVESSPMTLAGFAAFVEIPYRSLQNYVRGEREPSAEALRKLHEKWRVNINWLLTGSGEPSTIDYLNKRIVDQIISEGFKPVLGLCFDKESPLSRSDRVLLFSYAHKVLGLRSFIDALLPESSAPDFESLANWKTAFEEMAEAMKQDRDGAALGGPKRRGKKDGAQ